MSKIYASIRIPKELHDAAKAHAKKNKRSFNFIVEEALTAHVGAGFPTIETPVHSSKAAKEATPQPPKLDWKEKAKNLVLAYEDTHVTVEGGSFMFWLPGRTAAQTIMSEKESWGLKLWLEDLEKKGKLTKIPVDTDD